MRFHRPAFVEILDRSNYKSRADFARAVGMSPGALHDIETGRRSPSDDLIRRLAGELKVPLPALLANPEPEQVAS